MKLAAGPIPVVGEIPWAVEADTVQARVMLSRENVCLPRSSFEKDRPRAIQVVKEGKW